MKNSQARAFSAFLLIVCVFSWSAINAEVFKWVDADGTVHYGDKPAKNIPAKPIHIEPVDPSKYEQGMKLQQQLLKRSAAADQRIQERREQATQEAKEKNAMAAQAKACLESRKQLAVLQEESAVYRDENGKLRTNWKHDTYTGARTYIDEPQRMVEVERIQNSIQTLCEKPNDPVAQNHARTKWIQSEYCAARRAELTVLLAERKKSSRQEIEEKKKSVAATCGED